MNIYYNPEEFGLEVVKNIDTGGGYDFDMFVIWKDKKNNLYYGQDSGCSCPTPFEDFEGIPSLIKITKRGFRSFESELKSHCDSDITEYMSTVKEIKKLLESK